MTVQDPTKLSIQTGEHSFRSTVRQILAGLYTFTTGNEYLTLGAALQLSTDPAGTPATNTLYKANVPKAWIHFNMATDAIADSFNVSSITDGALGIDTVNVDQDFASAAFAPFIARTAGASGRQFVTCDAATAGSIGVVSYDENGAAFVDAPKLYVCAFGDQ